MTLPRGRRRKRKVSLMNLENQIIKLSATSIWCRGRVFESIRAHVSRSSRTQAIQKREKSPPTIKIVKRALLLTRMIVATCLRAIKRHIRTKDSSASPRQPIENTQFNAIKLTFLFSGRSFSLSFLLSHVRNDGEKEKKKNL
jgi:hypothetical protein